MKKILLAVMAAALMLLCFPMAASADAAYDITSYDVHITVSENNVIDVVERLTLNFTEQRHGFYYYLQDRGTAYREVNGESDPVSYRYKVSDFNVQGYKFELSRENGEYAGDSYLKAQIGDPDTYVYGEQVYVISYKCNLGDNGVDTFDEFYRNLIMCHADDTIGSASFIIQLPKDFDESAVSFTLGQYGSTNEESVAWEKDGDAVKGYVTRPMQGGEILTARFQFPDDYFTGETDPEAAWNIFVYVISGICVLLAALLWLLVGRDDPVYPTVEFYAPEGMTPAEAGYVIDGCVDNKDVVALILYWADKGYLDIVQRDKNDFDFVKKREPENLKGFERTMFSKLFAGGDTVSVSSLKYTFYNTMEATKTGVTNHFEGSKERRVFTRASKSARGWMSLLTMLPVAVTLFRNAYVDSGFVWAAIVTVIAGGLISWPVFMLVRLLERWRSTKPGSKAATLIVSIVLLALVMYLYIKVVPYMFPTADITSTLVTAAATLILMLLTAIMRKRTTQGSQWYGKLLGFKNFIDKAEKDRILKLVEENPSYYYNVLPYAYVLGVTDKWAKNFESIGIQPPNWYYGYYGSSMFNTILFTSMLTHNMSGFQSAMTSRPQSSGSGGFGGGGYSGGGFGGGGGFSGGGFGGGGAGGSW